MAMRTLWSPVNEFVTLRDAMDRLVSDSFINPRSMLGTMSNTAGLAANLYETPDSYIVQVSLPGVNPDAVQITVQGEVINIKGERPAPKHERAQQIWNGINFGPFEQTFSLPTAVEAENAQAMFEHGILSLTLPKVRNARAHTIKVTSGSAGSQPAIEQQSASQK
ncbi:MAG: Hsp20/alpha crystallin family protein [Chloroflexi bacterium]|nr:Hsp20/alpha crystallin family protein [Chloroflexota bacterium]